jgi:hypothetical protein
LLLSGTRFFSMSPSGEIAFPIAVLLDRTPRLSI